MKRPDRGWTRAAMGSDMGDDHIMPTPDGPSSGRWVVGEGPLPPVQIIPRYAVEHPHLLQAEDYCYLLFTLAPWFHEPAKTGVIEVLGCLGAAFGFGSDDGGWGYDRGSTVMTAIFVVPGSARLSDVVERQTYEWPGAQGRPVDTSRHCHLVAQFHDTVFECIAEGIAWRTDDRSLTDTLIDLVGDLPA